MSFLVPAALAAVVCAALPIAIHLLSSRAATQRSFPALAFLRRARHGTALIFVMNATPVLRHGYRIGVPARGYWREILNTDSADYGGSNAGNFGGVHTEEWPWGGRPYSVALTLPPLAMIALKAADR